jgi:hypothetical protein
MSVEPATLRTAHVPGSGHYTGMSPERPAGSRFVGPTETRPTRTATAPADWPGRFRSMKREDQDALGSADGLSAGMLSAGALSAGVLDSGVVLESGVVVEAGVLQATTAPPRLAASVKASRIRFIIREPPLSGQGCRPLPPGPLGRATPWDLRCQMATIRATDRPLRLHRSRSGEGCDGRSRRSDSRCNGRDTSRPDGHLSAALAPCDSCAASTSRRTTRGARRPCDRIELNARECYR